MKKGLLVFLVLVLAAGAYYYRTHPGGALHKKVVQLQVLAVNFIRAGVSKAQQAKLKKGTLNDIASKLRSVILRKEIQLEGSAATYIPKNQVTLYMRNAKEVTGELINETPNDVTLRWEYGEATFARSEISRLIRHGESEDAALPDVASKKAFPGPSASENEVTLYLKNGGIVTGELVRETPERVVLRWEYGEVEFSRGEIEQVKQGREKEEEDIILPTRETSLEWAHTHDAVFRLLNGTILDYELHRTDTENLYFTQVLEAGGQVELTIPRADLDQVMFRPIKDEHSKKTRAELEERFPDMRWYEDGLFSLATDSLSTLVPRYQQAVRELSTDFYLGFYPMLKGRSLTTQQYLVIFDDHREFVKWTAVNGLKNVAGFYDPSSRIFYSYNVRGERFSDILATHWLGSARQSIDNIVDHYKDLGDRGYRMYVEGWGSDKRKAFESAHARLRQMYWDETISTLRHELTHAMFHNMGLQSVDVRDMQIEAEPETPGTETAHDSSAQETFLSAVSGQEESWLSRYHANNSWFVEGLAQYMEPSPVGGIVRSALSKVQEARATNAIVPLEFLMAFRGGSFRGTGHKSKLYSYAQSWAFAYFLMERYPEGFFKYLGKVAATPTHDSKDVDWLFEVLGKDLRALEQEFHDFIYSFPPEDSPTLRRKQIMFDLRQSLH